MRKVLAVAALMMVLSFASAKSYMGVFSGYPEAIGVQYTMDSGMRFSIGLPVFGGFGVAGSADMIMGSGPLGVEGFDLNYYYGAGVSAFFVNYTFYGSAFGVNGHGLLGVEWMIPDTNFGVFSEAQIGAEYDSYFAFGPFFGGRFGVNFR
ncbi:hypothetical protein Ocepr_1518 [Oceanithermus profundus DSM 14977]|uniref:Outer membrane protein beta-barrel domain-containing protein n=1 Tax=Oceanithermus profundus (strain DSM 14977 / NBRC 100410 / VKM B-2274 / 506) TaxID=670487 RepID=E4U4H8_OCEP5|nr:hypothetical protein [Oceanithermus profundus]ADR36971.1 hypothetical protein Ocepr_1518 [Oceanithermus profundus DSM 14977]